jgi:hypothetical protein
LFFVSRELKLTGLKIDVQNYLNVSLQGKDQEVDQFTKDLKKNEWVDLGLKTWLSLAHKFRDMVQPYDGLDVFNANGDPEPELAITAFRVSTKSMKINVK